MTKRLKASERKASILTAAKILFADKGYHGVSVDEIARRLGVSPAVLYRHFPSKEALYDEVLSVNATKRESYIEAILAEPDDFASVLKRMSIIFSENISSDPDYLRMEMMSALENSQVAMSFFDRRWRSITDFIEYQLDEIELVSKRNGPNPMIASLMYRGMLREILYTKYVSKDDRYKDISLKILIDEAVKTFMQTIVVQQGKTVI